MVSVSTRYPVVIIGGGPAGLATSLVLSSRGVEHCIVEAREVAGTKPGEAIPPNARPLFRQLGIGELLEHENHRAYYGNLSSWGDTSLQHDDFFRGIYGSGYLLDRPFFEKQLTDKVKNTSTMFFQGYAMKKLARNTSGELTVIIEDRQDSISLTADYIVDATGRKASVCRHLGVQKEMLDEQVALILRVQPSGELQHQIWIEATENGWWYAAPYGKDELMLLFFTDKELLPPNAGISDFVKKEFENVRHLPPVKTGIRMETVRIMPVGSGYLTQPFGKGWIAVGDAAYVYDPVSSFGITSALVAGYYGGHALAEAIGGDPDAFGIYQYMMETAFQDYLKKVVSLYDTEKRWASGTYWRNRFKQTTASTFL